MAALDFPNSPINGTQYTAPNGAVYTYDGTAWTVSGVLSTGTTAGGDLAGTYPNPTVTAAAKSKWTTSGTTITPTDATKTVTVVLSAAGGLDSVIWGNAGGAARSYLSTNPSLGVSRWIVNASSAMAGLDVTSLPAWQINLGGGDALALYRAPAAGGVPVFASMLNVSNTGNLTITGATATKASGTTWVNPSDPRLKRDVTPYIAGLKEIAQLTPITYKYNGLGGTVDDDRQCYGLDASAVEPVMPECIGTRTAKLGPDDEHETELLTLDASCIIWALVNAVKELTARVATLEAVAPAHA